jgi:predicted dehydrogenase
MPSTRRQFLSQASALSAFGAVPLLGQNAPKSGRKYRTAIIGAGWWGMNILREAMAHGRVKVIALCDVDQDKLDNGFDDVKADSGDEPKKYKDYREMLQKERPDITIIATPDHWHALQTIACAKFGSHVYCEKPTGHTVNESRAMVKAAKNAGVIVQVGLHRRIGPHHVQAMQVLRSGIVGKVGMVRCFAHSKGGAELPKPNSAPPQGMDWDLWCGPAPLRPFNSKIHPGGWRGFLDYSNGTMGDWGVHWLDQVMWWSGQKAPKTVFCTGGRPIAGPVICNEQEQTTDAPDHQIATFEFDGFTATWEHRKFADNNSEAHKIGTYFYGEKGIMHIGWRDGWTFHPVNEKAQVMHGNAQLEEPDGHNIGLLWADLIDSIDRRRKPVADIEIAHRSSCLPFLGMLSYKLGRSIAWDGEKEQILGDAQANKLLGREYRKPWEYPEIPAT